MRFLTDNWIYVMLNAYESTAFDTERSTFNMRMKTLLTAALFAKEGEMFAPVALPHTWNALDGQDGGADYWRGIGTYKIDLPNPTQGKKQYIEFQGANHVATYTRIISMFDSSRIFAIV